MALDLSMLSPSISEKKNEELIPGSLLLRVDQLCEDPENPRKFFDQEDLEVLANSIAVKGIITKISVKPAVDGIYQIRFGARRFRAGKMAGLTEFPCVLVEDARHFDGYSQVAENLGRADLTPLEKALFIEKMLAAGEKKKDIAKNMSMSDTEMTFLCALIDMPDFLQEAYNTKTKTPEYLYKIRNLHKKNAELVEKAVFDAKEINRAFVEELTALVSGKSDQTNTTPIQEPTSTNNVLDVLPKDTESGGDAPPEKAKTKKDPDPETVKYKIIMVKHDQRPAYLVLNRRASAIGLGWIKYIDTGEEVEITLNEAVLDSLIEG